jgi:hypothetical protein
MLFSLYWALLLSVLLPQASENNVTKIVSRHTFGVGATEQTIYIMADRRRMEMRHSVQRRDNNGPIETRDELSSVFIVRCDLGESFILYPQREEYSSAAYPPNPLTPEGAAPGFEKPGTAEPAKPTLRVETATVDTGERMTLFGYSARHVIATRKQMPLEGSNSERQETVTDGWYIDLDRSISCDPKPSGGNKGHGLVVSRPAADKERPIEIPEFVDIGARETGFPLKEARTSPMTTIFPDGTKKTSDHLDESEVRVLEKVTLDPALFEVPAGYKHVDGNQRKSPE